MFSKELELSISQAYQHARDQRHEYLTVEHMLLALLDNASALSILSACGADVSGLDNELRISSIFSCSSSETISR